LKLLVKQQLLLTAYGLDKSTYENKLVFLMGVEKARFRNPVIPDCELIT
jgi:3-hydroxyacyl-[acyl-carrier-protein] dehydratase